MERSREGLIEVGRVTGIHGLRGKVRVAPYSGDPSGVLNARWVRIAAGEATVSGGGREFEVIAAQRAGSCAVFSLRGIDSLESARELAEARVSVLREELPSLPEGEFYYADAVGCAVVDIDGNDVGEVTGVLPGPAHDWLVVRRGGEEAYLPVVAAFLRSVDVPARRVVVSPPEGW